MSASSITPHAPRASAKSTASATPATPRSGAVSVRRHELDWLRTAAVFGLIPFHTAVIFTTGSYDYVKNAQTSALMDVFTSFISLWGISLLFLVAGGASRFALASRSVGQYLNERVTRLLIPFVVGMLVIVPLQVYVGRLSAPTPAPSFPAFYIGFIGTVFGIFTGHIPNGPEWIGHLWFIPPLIAFSALALPFARLLRTPRGARAVSTLASAGRGYLPLALFGLPLVAVQYFALEGVGWFPTIDSRVTTNAMGIVAYLIFFLYGYLLYLDDRFITSVRRDAWLALALGTAAWLIIVFVVPLTRPDVMSASLGHVFAALMRGYCSWWWVMGILGMGARYLQFTTPAVSYLTQAAYPVYIIHMLILSVIGMEVVRWDLGILPKFALIVLATLAISLIVYEVLIRRIGVLRLIFGLRPRASAAAPPVASGSVARRGPTRPSI